MSGDDRQGRGGERTSVASDDTVPSDDTVTPDSRSASEHRSAPDDRSASDTVAMPLQDPDTGTAASPFARPDSGASPAGSAALPPPVAPGPDRSDESPLRAPALRIGPRAEGRGARPGRRRARLGLTRVDPWSVFVLSLVVSLFLGVVLLVAVSVLYALLDGLGVLASVDGLARELDLIGEGQPLFGLGRVLGLTAVIAAVDIVLLTVLATLAAFLYNLCAALTGGVEVTLTERD